MRSTAEDRSILSDIAFHIYAWRCRTILVLTWFRWEKLTPSSARSWRRHLSEDTGRPSYHPAGMFEISQSGGVIARPGTRVPAKMELICCSNAYFAGERI